MPWSDSSTGYPNRFMPTSFILKGALMLRVWGSPELRPTMDIDMLGRTSNEEADIVAQIQDILTVDVETDGLDFRS